MRTILYSIIFSIVFSQASAQQSYWNITKDFPGGYKTSLTGLQDSVLFVSTAKGVWRSVNEGFTWTHVLASSTVVSTFVTSSKKILAGGVGKVFYSNDLGVSWDSVKVDTNYPVKKFAQAGGRVLFITGVLDNEDGFVGDGVFSSDGNFNSWQKRNNGIPASFRSMDWITSDRFGNLYAASADEEMVNQGGLFRSADNGNSWQHISINGVRNAKGNTINEVYILQTSSISISPEDTLFVSVKGTTGNSTRFNVQLNLKKHINDITKTTSWTPLDVSHSSTWWDDYYMEEIHFARDGKMYSSKSGSLSFGGSYISSDKGKTWKRYSDGIGLDAFGFFAPQSFYETSGGKIFMAQFLDERLYWSPNSIVEPYVLSGKVLNEQGNGMMGISVDVGHTRIYTDMSGSFSTKLSRGWSGAIVTSGGMYSYSPARISINNISQNTNAGVITGTYIGKYYVTGFVRDASGAAVDGIELNGLPDPVVTNQFGHYVAELPPHWSGTISPSKNGYSFSPLSLTFNDLTKDLHDQNFIIHASNVHIITGTIKDQDGYPLTDVNLSSSAGTIRVNDLGQYVVEVSPGWSGDIVATQDNYVFNPEKISFADVQQDVVSQNFTGTTNTFYTVSGRIVDTEERPLKVFHYPDFVRR